MKNIIGIGAALVACGLLGYKKELTDFEIFQKACNDYLDSVSHVKKITSRKFAELHNNDARRWFGQKDKDPSDPYFELTIYVVEIEVEGYSGKSQGYIETRTIEKLRKHEKWGRAWRVGSGLYDSMYFLAGSVFSIVMPVGWKING